MKKSLVFLKELDIKNETLVVGVSGGADSMTLLHLLNNNGYKVICAHVNHGLRKESEEEYLFVENYCKINNIVFEGMKIDGYINNKFTENEARNKRYKFFSDILKKYNSKYLITAHHGDDLVETIIMRLIRGSNINGYKGFSKISKYEDFTILRPLIFYTKDEIEKYINDNNIPFVIDNSNSSKKYTRNRIRLDMLPLLKRENKNVNEQFLKFNEEINELQEYVNLEIDSFIKNNYSNNKLYLEEFNNKPLFLKSKIVEKILLDIYKGNILLINKSHVNSILKIIGSSNKSIHLPKNLVVCKEYDYLVFSYDKIINKLEYKYELNDEVKIDNYGVIKFIDDTSEKSNYVLKLNSKDIKLPLIIRNNLDGDKMIVKNMNGSKKISRIFIDEKITKDIRNGYPVLTDSNDKILWIPGIKKSNFDCYNKDFYDIIIKYIKKGE